MEIEIEVCILLFILMVILGCIYFKFNILENLSWTPNLPKGLGREKKSIVRTDWNSFVKTYKPTRLGIERYYTEKTAYTILRNSNHIPTLFSYDDLQLSLEFKDSGIPIRFLISNKDFEIPNWNHQIESVIAELDTYDITHGDWSGANLLYHEKTGTINVIDFGTCRLPGQRFSKSKMRIPVCPFKGQTLEDYIHFIDGGIWVSVKGRWKQKKIYKRASPWKTANELNQDVVPKNYYTLHPPPT